MTYELHLPKEKQAQQLGCNKSTALWTAREERCNRVSGGCVRPCATRAGDQAAVPLWTGYSAHGCPSYKTGLPVLGAFWKETLSKPE